MVVILSIETRCEEGQRLLHGEAVLMKDMWITKAILILLPHHLGHCVQERGEMQVSLMQ